MTILKNLRPSDMFDKQALIDAVWARPLYQPRGTRAVLADILCDVAFERIPDPYLRARVRKAMRHFVRRQWRRRLNQHYAL